MLSFLYYFTELYNKFNKNQSIRISYLKFLGLTFIPVTVFTLGLQMSNLRLRLVCYWI